MDETGKRHGIPNASPEKKSPAASQRDCALFVGGSKGDFRLATYPNEIALFHTVDGRRSQETLDFLCDEISGMLRHSPVSDQRHSRVLITFEFQRIRTVVKCP